MICLQTKAWFDLHALCISLDLDLDDARPVPEGKAWLASDRDYTYDEVRFDKEWELYSMTHWSLL